MKKLLPLLAYYLTLIISYQVCRLLDLFTPSQLQIMHFPLVLLPALIWKIKFLPFSRILAGLAACIGFAGYQSIASQHQISTAAVTLAQFSDDAYGKESRVFLAKLESALEPEGRTAVTAQHSELSSRAELGDLFSNNPELKLVIGGNSKWIKIVERPQQLAELNDFTLTADLFKNLKIITQVPVFELSRDPLGPTVQFLTNFINASLVPEALKEVYLFSASAYLPVWLQSSHLSYARFKAANQILFKMLNGSEYQVAEMACIRRQYRRAAKQIMGFHNPELTAALNNNIAVMDYLAYIFEHKHKSLPVARKLLKAAMKVKRMENEFGLTYLTPYVAQQNLSALKSKINKTKKKKRNERKKRKNKKTVS